METVERNHLIRNSAVNGLTVCKLEGVKDECYNQNTFKIRDSLVL